MKRWLMVALMALAAPLTAQGGDFNCNNCYMGAGITATLTIDEGGPMQNEHEHTLGMSWSKSGGSQHLVNLWRTWKGSDGFVLTFPAGSTSGSKTNSDTLNGCMETYAGALTTWGMGSNAYFKTKNSLGQYASHWHDCDLGEGGPMWEEDQ